MSFDASAGRLRCPFCGSERLEQQADKKVLSPTRVVPFVIDQDQALARMRSWLRGGIWRPSNLSQQAAVVSISAVYVPYWVFQAQTHTFWTADTDQVPYGARGDWYPLTGEHHGRYSGLLVGASGVLTPRETSAICPFDLDAGVPPGQLDLDNVIVEDFSIARKYARPQARQGLEAREVQTCRQQYVPGRSRHVKVNVRVEGLSSEPVLLPVWMLAYRYRQKTYRFLMNGQTGQSTGTAPVTYTKVGIIAAALAVAVLLLLLVLLSLLR
ncbi:MAG: hypothetical protein GTO53_08175 [Planctomycetales bacterium]|nr:hypothetical protein [Planctomycetales bacterium]NIM09109.1 hypothetical protein [Planctomycetales bacterium]NIN08580.1 hypothetical protein [Planctomycetales bacterium]NIN77702.1 hypothetical protein [Planctomycetales bacterium]NIO34878.1 hypothetical protein [Planctomycetales bacterium]